ncbi:uncharacterized protein ACWYII_027724 isoform 2-T6 [Salvelinus alpinus]
MAPTKMKLRVRRRESGGAGQEQEETSKASSQSVSAEASPDSKCPICLDRFNNMSYLDRCLHRFCFRCIQEWSNNKVECPLCKQPFSSILHSIKAQDNFKEFTLRPPPVPGENGTAMIAAAEAAAVALVTARVDGSRGERRRTRRRGGGGGGVGQGRGGRERRQSGRLWRGRGLSSAPPLPPLHPPLLPRPEDGGMRGEMDGEDPGVIFDGLTGASAPPPHDRGVQRLMVRLAARRRSQREGRSVRLLRPREMLSFRRALYRSGVRVRNARGGCERPRDITAAFYQRNPVALHRLLPWLQRELTVLYGAHGSLVNIVQRIITSRIARHDMEGGGGAIQDELRPFLLARTDHFLHELISFARSPLSMEVYDQLSIYDPPAPSYEDRMTSSSSDTDDSVIAISDEEEEEGGSEGERERRPVSVAGSSALSQSAWDDETPGPSYSTAKPSQSPMPLSISPGGRDSGPAGANQNPAQDMTAAGDGERVEEGGEEEEGEQCMIVGFVKAMAERTPELVQLSSDPSDEEGEKQEKTVQQTALTPLSLVIPPLSIPVPPISLFKNTSTERQGGGGERQGGGGERQGEGGERVVGVRHLDRESEQVEERLLYCPLGERREGRQRERSCSGSRSRSRHRSASVWSRSGRSRSSERSWSARSPVSVRSDDSSQERRRKRLAREREKRRQEKGRDSHDRGSYRQHSREHSGGSERNRGRERERIPYEPARSQYSNTGIFFSPENCVLSHSPSLSRSSQRGPESPGEHRHSPRSDSLSSSSSLSHLSVSADRRHSRHSPRSDSLSSSSSLSHLSTDRQHSRHSPRSDKPGGKRKYKTRHLEDPSWEPSSSARRERGRGGEREKGRGGEREKGRGGEREKGRGGEREKGRGGEREKGRGGEREKGRGGEREKGRGGTEATASPRKSRGSLKESGKKRRRQSRSPSVEIIYEGMTVTAASPLRPKHKRHGNHRRKQRHDHALQRSPVVITIDSDSDNKHTVQTTTLEDDGALDLSDRATVDFSDRSLTAPGLPLGDHNNPDMGVDISDLAVDILDRFLSVSDRNSDIDRDDVIDRKTNVDDDCVVDVSVNVKDRVLNTNTNANAIDRPQNVGGHVLPQVNLSCDPRVATSDSRLLATILQDLEHIALPNLSFFPNLNPNPNHSRNSTTPDHSENARPARETTPTPWSSERENARPARETTPTPWSSERENARPARETTPTPWSSERENARPARETTPTPWSSERENARPARETTPTPWSSEGENARPARETTPTPWSSEGETNFNSPVSPTANHSLSSESFTDYHSASPISPVGHPASPISPVGHPASPISPVSHSASPISPVGHSASPISPVGHSASLVRHSASPISPIGHPASPISPVGHPASPISPLGHSASPVGHSASPISPVGHPASPISPVGHSASPISPVGHSACPISPVGHPASPISPVGHPASPISPVGHSASPISPVGHSASPISPVGHSAGPISPVGHPASPISPVSHSASPISPVGHYASPIGHSAGPISPLGHYASPVHQNSNAVSPVVHPSNSPLSSPIAGSISVDNPRLPSSTGSSVSASPVSASPVSASPVSASPVSASPVSASPVSARHDQEGPIH